MPNTDAGAAGPPSGDRTPNVNPENDVTAGQESAGSGPSGYTPPWPYNAPPRQAPREEFVYAPPPQGSWNQPPGGGYQPPGAGYPPPAGGWGQPPPVAGPSPGRKSGQGRSLSVAIAASFVGMLLLVGGVGASLGWGLAGARLSHSTGAGTGRVSVVSPAQATGNGSQLDAQAIAKKVDPAVVDVNTVVGTSGQAAGTGMLVTSSGAVLTNNHVVDGATRIQVTVAGKSGSYPAKVLGVDPTADVALIQVQGLSGLPTVTLADSSSLSVGQGVVAIGNAMGQGGQPTVTQGVVTALDRAITAGTGNGNGEQLSGLVESDAPISPGDSGGALVNSAGQVVGMITAGTTQGFRQTTSTDGFAVPSSTAAGIVNQILAGHASSTVILGPPGYLGVQVQDIDQATASRLGLNVGSGTQVVGVVAGSPADQAGIPQGAVITEVDGTATGSPDTLHAAIRRHKAGDQMRVAWVDTNGKHSATVTLATSLGA